MPDKTIIMLSPQNITKLGHNVMIPHGIRCEWTISGKQCPVLLGCYEFVKQHHLRHCKMQKKQRGGFICSLPRCNARTHPTLRGLCDHVEQAHMSRTSFPCPVDGCQSLSFTDRSNLLPDHFLSEHPELNGMVIQLPSTTLRPCWQPFSPSIPSPPKLPENLHPGSVLLMPTASVIRKRIQPAHTFSSKPSSPHKPQRQIPHKDMVEEQGEDGLQIPEFGTLPRYNKSCQPQDLVIWRRPGVFDMDVSQPQHMRVSPLGDASAPLSILYEVFAKKFDNLERNVYKTA
ncbi:hypothetical protein L208DRAFT_1412659 [Tricholoma matsutake]|nr:hypothetical protein L208DRAFT_1412659 [Tricholoma matsutake 945]